LGPEIGRKWFLSENNFPTNYLRAKVPIFGFHIQIILDLSSHKQHLEIFFDFADE
jgi:hypothetical protein